MFAQSSPAFCYHLSLTQDSPPDTDVVNDSPASKKRPFTAIAQLEHESSSNPVMKTVISDSPRKRDRLSIIRVEKTPSITIPPDFKPPAPRPRTSPRRLQLTPVTTPKKQRNISMKTGSADEKSGGRSRSAIPSSQSPSPLKSPAADRVRKQLAAILEDEDDNDTQDDSANAQLPPIRSRTASNTSGSGARKKARPKTLPRFKVRRLLHGERLLISANFKPSP